MLTAPSDSLYVPGAHLMHEVEVFDPLFGLYVPAGQTVHDGAFVDVLKLPAGHTVQLLPPLR